MHQYIEGDRAGSHWYTTWHGRGRS